MGTLLSLSIVDVPELIALLRDMHNDTWNVGAKEASHQMPESIDETLCGFANMLGAVRSSSGSLKMTAHLMSPESGIRRLRSPHFDDQITKFTAILTSSSLLSNTDLRWLGQLPGTDALSVAQKHALIAMRHGEEITNSSYRSAFPMDSVNARAELQQLVQYGLADAAGSGRGTTYSAPSEDDNAPTETLASDAAQTAEVSADGHAKHSTYLSAAEKDQRILAALRAAQHGLTRKELERETGLTRGQINPRIAKLNENEIILNTPSDTDSRVQKYSLRP